MIKRFVVATAFLAVPFVALPAAAQVTTPPPSQGPITSLPSNLQQERMTIQQDQLQILNVVTQMRTDNANNNTNAVAAGRTALRIAQLKLETDMAKLRTDAQTAMQGDITALNTALTQLQQSQSANNGNSSADQTAVNEAEQTLAADRALIFGGLGSLVFGGGSDSCQF